MKTVISILFIVCLFVVSSPALAQQPIGTPPVGQPLGPQPGTSQSVFVPTPAPFVTLAPAPITPPPPPPANDPSVRQAVVIGQTFLYGFNLWTDQFGFGCNRAPSMLMLTKPGEHITVQLNPGRGLDSNTWVRVLDGWYQDCYVQTWALSIS